MAQHATTHYENNRGAGALPVALTCFHEKAGMQSGNVLTGFVLMLAWTPWIPTFAGMRKEATPLVALSGTTVLWSNILFLGPGSERVDGKIW